MHAYKHWTLTDILHTFVVVAAIAGLAATVGLGIAADRSAVAPIRPAGVVDAAGGRPVTDAGATQRSAPVAQDVPSWRARYDALKERQIARLEAARPPCGRDRSPRESYEDLKLRQGDSGGALTAVPGCDA